MSVRVTMDCRASGHTHLDKMLAAGVRTDFGDEWVRVGTVKIRPWFLVVGAHLR